MELLSNIQYIHNTYIYIYNYKYIDDTTKYIDDIVCIYIDRHEERLSEPSQLFKRKEIKQYNPLYNM